MPSLRKLDGRGAAASVTRDGEDAEAQAAEAPKKGKKRKLPKKDNSHKPQSRKRGDGGGSKQATSEAAAATRDGEDANAQTEAKAKKGKNRKLEGAPIELPFTGICQRGKLVCNIGDNGAGVHRITGLWAMEGLSRILEAPDECEKFEYEHMCSGDSTAFELSGRYTGGFFNGAVKIVERDVTLRFQHNNAGYHNVDGEGSNVFGKYNIVGTLAENGTITLSRHYPVVGRPAERAAVARSLDDRYQVARDSSSASGGGGSGPLLTDEEKKDKERFLMFTRVLMKYLEQRDAVMHANAKTQIKECYEKNKQGDPAFQSLTTSMKARLRETVGELYWKKAHDYLDHFLRQKKDADAPAVALNQAIRAINSEPATAPLVQRSGGKRKREDEEGEGEGGWAVYTGVEDFRYRKDILRVRVAPNVTKIPEDAFVGCTNLMEVDLCNVIEIGAYAFGGCVKLKKANLARDIMHHRREMIQHIVKLLEQKDKNAWPSPEWLTICVNLTVKQLEELLFRSSPSFQYADTSTLKTRLQQLATEIAKKTQQAKDGSGVAGKRKPEGSKSNEHGSTRKKRTVLRMKKRKWKKKMQHERQEKEALQRQLEEANAKLALAKFPEMVDLTEDGPESTTDATGRCPNQNGVSNSPEQPKSLFACMQIKQEAVLAKEAAEERMAAAEKEAEAIRKVLAEALRKVDRHGQKESLLRNLGSHNAELRPSSIDGVGVFALAPIPVGTKLFQFNGRPTFFRTCGLSAKEIGSLPNHVQRTLRAFILPDEEGLYHVPEHGLSCALGVSYYLNSAEGTSQEPNVEFGSELDWSGLAEMVATRHIGKDEELLLSYKVNK